MSVAAKNLNSKKALYIKTFGCQMNVHDTEKLIKLLEESYRLVSQPNEADLVIVNTCSVREKPEHKLYSFLGEMRVLKKRNPGLLVGVCGCVAQQEGQKIVKRSSAVDIVFGTHNLSRVNSLISLREETGRPQVAVDYRESWEDLPHGFSGAGRASVYIAISRGCNKNCTYCIVPRTRGREVSREPSEISDEIQIAVRNGAKEVILLGQTVNSYGRGLKPRLSFVGLLDQLSEIEDLARIRFTSPHPQEVNEEFCDLYLRNSKVCKHVHMPLQSGSDNILKAMKRSYRRERYLEIINSIKSRVPDMAVTTDIIVGFPGETDQDFQDTLDIVDQVQFESSYSFMFSPRPGTPAAEMEGQLSDQVKLNRLQILQARQEEITGSKLEAWIGKEAEVLLDGYSQSNDKLLQGRLSQNILVNLELEELELGPGMIVPVRISGRGKHTLKGCYLNSA